MTSAAKKEKGPPGGRLVLLALTLAAYRRLMTQYPADATLLVIDVQKAFDHPRWGPRNNPDAERNVGLLLGAWRDTGRPVIHVNHRNPGPGGLFSTDQPGFEVKPEARPTAFEQVVFKDVNSAFIGTDLEARLRGNDVAHLVVCGLTTDHCVSTTTRMAGNLGFTTTLVGDACATFARVGPTGRRWTAQDIHESALASINDEFATVIDTKDLLSALSAVSLAGQ